MFVPSLPRSAFERRKPPRAKRLDRKDAPKFLKWLKGLPCACGGKNKWCAGKSDPAHVDYAAKGTPDAKGLGTKVADRFSIPLSRGCHAKHTDELGWDAFEQTLPTKDAEALSRAYWQQWPGRREWERDLVASQQVAER